MSEVKRVPLQTLEFPESLGHAAKKEKKGEKGKQLAPSFRFTLTLPESNEKACPEFNYAQLYKAAEKKRRKEQKGGDENTTNGLDPYDDDDEDKLKDMARRFEAKYGTTTLGKKRHKYDDYVDLGAGYDENDSFIDNTDAYDEIVPEEMTTAHGGFYINCGALEFKAAERHSLVHNNNNNKSNNDEDESSDSSEEETEDVDSPKRADKRNLSSSEDDEVDDMSDQPRKKQKVDENGDKKSNHENVIKKKKKKPQNHQTQERSNSQQEAERRKEKGETTDAEGGTVSEDQEEKKKPDKELQKTKATTEKKFDIKKFEKKPSSTNSSNGCDAKKIDLKKLPGKDSNIDDAIESVVNAARVEDESSQDTSDSGKSRGNLGTDSECDDIDKEAPLPDGLPEDIKEIVNKLKVHAENSKEGKSKFFNPSVNSALFSLEKKLRTLNSASARPQTYEHLARFLPCSKITLLNRAKKLYLQDAEYRVKETMQRLKAIIDNTMPSVMDAFIQESQMVADENPQLYWEIYRYCWGFEGSPAAAESSDEDEGSCKSTEKSKIPKKRFPWTDETKKLVYEIANARRQYFKILRPRKESMESFVATFMDTKVLPLWPSGYVRLQTLLKYSNSVEPTIKRKAKKLKDVVSTNSVSSSANTICNSSTGRLEATSSNNNNNNVAATSASASTSTSTTTSTSAIQEMEKTPPTSVAAKVATVNENSLNVTNIGTLKSNDNNAEKKQISSKNKEKNKDNGGNNTGAAAAAQFDVASNIVSNSTVGKISVVPTAQLMAQKPTKSHLDKFNLMDLANSSLSITPVNDYHKIPAKTNEVKKDVVSITAYPEPSNIISNANEVPQSGHVNVHRQETSYPTTQHSNYSLANQTSPHSKPVVSLKHRILQDNAEIKNDKRLEDKDVEITNKTEKRDNKRRERCMENKHKSQDTKKRRKDPKLLEQVGPPPPSIHSEIVSLPQQTSLSKEEQEQRQIEETVAATTYLSQIINDDTSARTITDKRKDGGYVTDESIGSMVSTEQEKDVQMVMRSLKELQELQEMNCSPSHSPVNACGIQKPNKSSVQYVTYQEEYQRLYLKKEDKLRPKEEAQW
ncbi:PREDICTED: yemanuclein-alpha isoform X2 [Polistes dominula]|uniref:Yemanuclein-alpha isoform X2 n=1 Tax=Polistes dominula TaxID=743375 RepID=A0ABM1HT37_POLDO|nr:PREDICTED: yemanuclein-alpha isoform X2 [Polistes dominula]